MHKYIYILGLLLFGLQSQAQTTVKGRVIDGTTGEAMPYVNVIFKGTSIGASTNFDGYYTLTTTQKVDSISVSFLGFITQTKGVKNGIAQTVDFQLLEAVTEVGEVVVTPGENPANKIIKWAQDRKDINEYKSLEAYQYESFTKVFYRIQIKIFFK